MTDGNLYFPQYRPGSAKVVAPGSFALAGMAGGLAGMSRSGVPVPVTLGLLVMLVIAFALLVVAFKRSATITGPDHIVVQNAFGTKRTAWAEIQAIEVQSNPAALLETNKPREYVVVYDSSGRVVQLPHVDAKSVPALHDEVRTLRGLWEQLRGGASGFKLHEDWGSTPAAINACLSVADASGVQVALHTDTLNEAGFVEDTIGAINRRSIHAYHTEGAGGGHAPDIIRVADLEIDVLRRRVTRGATRIDLTAKEFALLHLLAKRQGEVLSRTQIASMVWDMNFDSDTNVVDVAIRRLRAKVDDPYSLKLVQTVRGMGYLLEPRP